MTTVRAYNADSVSVLTAVEGVRNAPSMYLGSTDAMASLQCFMEIVQNCIDELREAGRTRLRVVIRRLRDGSQEVTVADQGRGIPVEIHPKTRLSTLETVLTHLHAGAKSQDKSAYGKRTIGVHGVGASAVNACSVRMDAWSFRGAWHHVQFAQGARTEPLARRAPPFKWPCGTIIRYVLDKAVLPEDLRLSDAQRFCALARHWDDVTIEYQDEERTATLTPRTPGDLMRTVLRTRDARVMAGPVVINQNGVRAVVAWTDLGGAADVVASVAGTPVPQGTHVQGLLDAVGAAFNKRGTDVDGSIGLLAVLDVSVDRPSFAGQNKTALKTSETRRRVREACTPVVLQYLKRHPDERTAALEHLAEISQINRRAQERREDARSAAKSKTTRHSLPLGFKSATEFPPHQRELFLLEGKCFTGDTAVLMADGSTETFESMVASPRPRLGLASNPQTGATEIIDLIEPRVTKYVTELVEVSLSDGSTVRVTPDHLWLLRDGSYLEAERLPIGTSLRVADCLPAPDGNPSLQKGS